MLISTDAGQLEWRVLVQLARDKVALEELLSGSDFHSLNQKEFNLPDRLTAKIYLFRTIYRGSGWSFAHDPAFMHVSKDPKFWDDIGEKFYKKYRGIDRCHQEWSKIVMRGEPIVGPMGREWFIPNRDKHGELYIPWTTLTNYPVQGLGADIMALARVSFYRRLKTLQIPVLPVSTVHDSIVVDGPEEYIQPVNKLMHEVFRDIPKNIKRMFNYNWVVPMTCEVKYGKDLKNMQKV